MAPLEFASPIVVMVTPNSWDIPNNTFYVYLACGIAIKSPQDLFTDWSKKGGKFAECEYEQIGDIECIWNIAQEKVV
jgi:hypothetical protein